VTLSDRQAIFTINVAKLILLIQEQGYSCTFGEAYRTPEQASWNAMRGSGVKNSLHCKRLAVDLNLFYKGEYLMDSSAHKPFGEWWEALHPDNRWGGRFHDGNHYSMMDGVTNTM